MFLRTSIAVITAVAIASFSRDAAACTDSGIGDKDSAYVAPTNGTPIPANVERLFFHSATGCPPNAIDKVTLVDGAGTAVPFTTEAVNAWDSLIVPTTPLQSTVDSSRKRRRSKAGSRLAC